MKNLFKIIAITLSIIYLPTLHATKTMLHVAAQMGNIKEFDTGISAGHNIDEQDENGYTPLHVACIYRQFDLVHHILLTYKPNLNILANSNQTPLFLVLDYLRDISEKESEYPFKKQCIKRSIQIINSLLNVGADPSLLATVPLDLPTAHPLTITYDCFRRLSSQSRFRPQQKFCGDLFIKILEHPKVKNEKIAIWPAVVKFAYNPNEGIINDVRTFVEKEKAVKRKWAYDEDFLESKADNKSNSVASESTTPVSLFEAIQLGNPELVKKTLQAGAKVTDKDIDGYTPLCVAVKQLLPAKDIKDMNDLEFISYARICKDCITIIESLLNAGANTDVATHKGISPLVTVLLILKTAQNDEERTKKNVIRSLVDICLLLVKQSTRHETFAPKVVTECERYKKRAAVIEMVGVEKYASLFTPVELVQMLLES